MINTTLFVFRYNKEKYTIAITPSQKEKLKNIVLKQKAKEPSISMSSFVRSIIDIEEFKKSDNRSFYLRQLLNKELGE